MLSLSLFGQLLDLAILSVLFNSDVIDDVVIVVIVVTDILLSLLIFSSVSIVVVVVVVEVVGDNDEEVIDIAVVVVEDVDIDDIIDVDDVTVAFSLFSLSTSPNASDVDELVLDDEGDGDETDGELDNDEPNCS